MNEKILVVDDEPDILERLETVLLYEHYNVRTASSGEEALEIFQTEPFDLVIADIKMPGMSGLELLKRLKQTDDYVEVIILTGFATAENAIEALRENKAFDFLTKPLKEIDELYIRVSQALGKRRLRMENRRLLKDLRQANADLERRIEIFNLEMSRAKDIYNLILAPQLPVMAGVEIHGRCIPAELVGGDVFEVLKADERRLLIFLADVTGHGIPAAMTANNLKILFREALKINADPAAICKHLNRILCWISLPDDVVVAFCGQIDLESMTLNYYLSGLPSPVIIRDNEKICLKPTGLPLGAFEDLVVECESLRLEKDDLLILFTDGITEAKSERGEFFGHKGVERSIGETNSAYDVVNRIVREASLFQQKDTFQDDVIVAGVGFCGNSSKMIWNTFCGPDKCIFKMQTKFLNIDEAFHRIMHNIEERSGVDFERVKIAFFELLMNAIEHGNLEMSGLKELMQDNDSEEYQNILKDRSNSDKYGERLIRVEYMFDSDHLEISVEDEGGGFDPQSVPDPTHNGNNTRLSGRGIFLAKMNADSLKYNAKGNKVTLLYRLQK
ncbi:SpoIIE family protein phosphatase [Desulfobacterales bacterium HSG2]|nr:SpoIIE family protein phosphatase [Desulfobacterales bacterium HSG2]